VKQIFLGLLLISQNVPLFSQNIFYQNASWSSDGRHICTEVIRKNNNDISYFGYIINFDEKKTVKKIDGMLFPSWSPDGKFIAYTKRNDSKHGIDILLMRVSTGESKIIFTDTVPSGGITFSPDTKKICFSSSHNDKKRGLYIINIDGSELQKLTTDTVKYFNPQWSPDGKYISYFRELGDNRDKVYIMRLKDKKEVKITDDSLHNVYPCWMPNGKTLYYTTSDQHSINPDNKKIAAINISNGSKKMIANTDSAFFAILSPNGKKLAFIKGQFPNTNIYVSKWNGKNAMCITCDLKLE
jgi:Tol biopolymer transport system component